MDDYLVVEDRLVGVVKGCGLDPVPVHSGASPRPGEGNLRL